MIKQKNILLFLITLGSLITSSCVSNKDYVYLQDKGNIKVDSNGTMAVQEYSYKLQRGDVLYISLTTEDEKLNKIFVPGVGGGQIMQQQQGVVGTILYFVGFTIDKQGEIEFPYLGKIKVEGKQVADAKTTIDAELRKYFKIFFLQVKVAEFKFSVLGNVNRPGQYFFQQNKVNIIEALALAGDLNNMAKRFELHLYRQYPDGVKLHVLNLTDRSLVSSAYWYIQPNDVLYVQPMKGRTWGDLSSFQTSLAVITPLLSSLLLVLNTYILVVNLQK